jgi:hypothetical protein
MVVHVYGPVHILPYDPQCHELFAIYVINKSLIHFPNVSAGITAFISGIYFGMITCT